jgi:hypothetical protein
LISPSVRRRSSASHSVEAREHSENLFHLRVLKVSEPVRDECG